MERKSALLLLVLPLALGLTGCDPFIKKPKPIKIWPASELKEFRQDDNRLVTAEERPIAELKNENERIWAENAELKREKAELLQKISKAGTYHSVCTDVNDHIKKQDDAINALWSAFHQLEERVRNK